jgi:UDP-3-O-[3-hydroxymyristoyl] glucosamine N-acyltransferase
VADKIFVGAQCGVISKNKGNGEQLIGSQSVNPKMYFKARGIDAKLPDMYLQVAALQREIDAIKEKMAIEF